MPTNSDATYGECEPMFTTPMQMQQDFHKFFGTTILQEGQELYYLFDYTRKVYLYIHPSVAALLGYDLDVIAQADLTHFWHDGDTKVFNEKIFPETMQFLQLHPVIEYPNFLFSFNFRILTQASNYITLLQRLIFVPSGDESMIAVSFLFDITNFKDDTRIIYTIEKLNDSYNTTTAKQSLYKSVYYPDKCLHFLSKREIEILEKMYEGLSSKKIADELCISNNTVSNHRKNILCKTKTTNIVELLKYVQKNGIFSK